MVLLTITPSILAAFEMLDSSPFASVNPTIGSPISHLEILALSRQLRQYNTHKSYSLDHLLRGTSIYIPPPLAKPEPTPEYQALMAHLRHSFEASTYEAFLSAPSRHSSNGLPSLFTPSLPSASFPTSATTSDDMVLADMHRQLTLVINILVSVVACGAAVWLVAGGAGWEAGSRVMAGLGAAVVVAVAEVGVYGGFLARITEAGKKEERVKKKEDYMKSRIRNGDHKIDVLPDGGGKSTAGEESDSVRRRLPAGD